LVIGKEYSGERSKAFSIVGKIESRRSASLRILMNPVREVVMCEGTCARAIRTELEYKEMISVFTSPETEVKSTFSAPLRCVVTSKAIPSKGITTRGDEKVLD
jgi:hypothetical protein